MPALAEPLVSALAPLIFIPSEHKHSQTHTPGREASQKQVLTESFVHHGLLLLFLAVFVHQGAEGVPAPDRRGGQRQNTGRGTTEERRKTAPLVVGGRPPQEHDDQQDGGEQEAPEGVVDPELPPVLWTETSALYQQIQVQTASRLHALVPLRSSWKQSGDAGTHGLAHGQSDGLGGPNDENDRG